MEDTLLLRVQDSDADDIPEFGPKRSSKGGFMSQATEAFYNRL